MSASSTAFREHVLPPLMSSIAAIEGAFLKAGDGLSHGLSAFGALNADMEALGTEIGSGAPAQASTRLVDLSMAVSLVGERLPRDARVLSDLTQANRAIEIRFGCLVDEMRMMALVSRSARIEAGGIDDGRIGLDAFTRAVSQQIGDVQREIQLREAELAELSATIRGAAQALAAFAAESRGRLMSLAGDLGDAAGVIRLRGERGSDLVSGIATRSAKLKSTAGVALVSLQVGDAVRQRLEHIVHAVTVAAELEGDDAPRPAAALSRLAAQHLQATLESLDEEVGTVLTALDVVAGETLDIVETGAATYGGGQGGSVSFMTDFQARFAPALDLVRTCEEMRRAVAGATVKLRAMLAPLQATIVKLDATSRDLVLVGVNVGLKAARLGPEARSLVVVAEELKRLAGTISGHAGELLPLFDQVQRASDAFDDGRDVVAGQLEREFLAIVGDIERGDHHIAALLRSINETGSGFADKLARARATFRSVADMGQFLDPVMGALDAADGVHIPSDEVPAIVSRLDAVMLPIYTMAHEREIHAEVTGAVVEAAAAASTLAA